ncbi:hypothetical protein LV779_05860 [Streptomyces thinghirensis]|nr:hypothetical protein [Streptomyces thinghirensis]
MHSSRHSRSPPPPAGVRRPRGGRRRLGHRVRPPGRRINGEIRIPDHIKDKLKEHGIDVDEWKNALEELEQGTSSGGADYVNPIIEDPPVDPDRAGRSRSRTRRVDDSDLSSDQGVTDPEPQPDCRRRPCPPKYRQRGNPRGQAALRLPQGSMSLLRPRSWRTRPTRASPTWSGRPAHQSALGQEGRLVPQHRLRALVQRRRQVDPRNLPERHPKGGRSVRRLKWGDWAETSNQVDPAGRRDGR